MSPWTDGYNMAILGRTQTGKTAVARELHATTSRLSIWVNERGKHRVGNIAGTEARSLEGVRKAFSRDEFRINYLPSDRNAGLVELQEWLWEVADRVDRQLEMQVIVDEVDRVAPQSQKQYGNLPARDAVRDFTSEGVKRGIKFVGITQDPVSYDKQALRQSDYRLVFDMSAENRDAVSKYSFAWEKVDETDRHTGVLHDANGQVLDGAVKAESRYA